MSAAPQPTAPGSDPRSASRGTESLATVDFEPNLIGARRLTSGAGIGFTDAGAGGALTIASTVTALLLGFQAIRLTTGSIALSTTANVTVNWSSAFADANYTPVVSMLDASGFLTVQQIITIAAASITVSVKNNDGAAAHTGTLLCLALHD